MSAAGVAGAVSLGLPAVGELVPEVEATVSTEPATRTLDCLEAELHGPGDRMAGDLGASVQLCGAPVVGVGLRTDAVDPAHADQALEPSADEPPSSNAYADPAADRGGQPTSEGLDGDAKRLLVSTLAGLATATVALVARRAPTAGGA